MNLNVANDNDSIKIAEIVSLLIKEVQIPTLQPVPFDTYQKIAATLENLQLYEYEGIEAKIRDTMVEMISTASKFLLEVRYHKMLDKQSVVTSSSYSSISSSTTTNTTRTPIDYSKLTEEEKYIMNAENESERRRNDMLIAIIRGRPKLLESISKRVRSKHILVRFVKPMEKFIGVDMEGYGPFRQEDIAVIPFENARSLIENNHAIEVQSRYR
jgi:DNA replication factor GINS